MVGWTPDKYITYRDLLDPTLNELTRLQLYISESKRMEQARLDHHNALKPTGTTTYSIGDVVAIQNHPLSSAGYGLKAKFMPRYTGEYIVVGQLSQNTYFVKDLDDANVHTIVTNVLQMTLLRRCEDWNPQISDSEPR